MRYYLAGGGRVAGRQHQPTRRRHRCVSGHRWSALDSCGQPCCRDAWTHFGGIRWPLGRRRLTAAGGAGGAGGGGDAELRGDLRCHRLRSRPRPRTTTTRAPHHNNCHTTTTAENKNKNNNHSKKKKKNNNDYNDHNQQQPQPQPPLPPTTTTTTATTTTTTPSTTTSPPPAPIRIRSSDLHGHQASLGDLYVLANVGPGRAGVGLEVEPVAGRKRRVLAGRAPSAWWDETSSHGVMPEVIRAVCVLGEGM